MESHDHDYPRAISDNTSSKIIKSDSQVQEIRAERAEQEAQMAEQQQQLAASEMAKNAAPAAKVLQEGAMQQPQQMSDGSA